MCERINTALRWGAEQIASCSDSARLDAEVLLSFCLNKPRSHLYSWPEEVLQMSCQETFRGLVLKRLQPTPIAYLVGYREFYSLNFKTQPSVLIPRPETELLVDLALAQCPTTSSTGILELGTGSGAIAVTLKKHRPRASILATDIDPACLALATENARQQQVKVEFMVSDWYANIPIQRRFDLIVSNPPYIAGDHPFLSMGDLPAEPAIALSPGKTGLEAIEKVVNRATRFLNPEGCLILEHGYDQQRPVSKLLKAAGFQEICCHVDHNDLPRTTFARSP